jgi:3-oxoacyl-(acyl-carrier-protein) synthase
LKTAVDEALSAASIDIESLKDETVGVCFGTNFGGAGIAFDEISKLSTGNNDIKLEQSSMGAALNEINSILPVNGPSQILSLSCASGTAAIGIASSWIKNGRADIVLCGGFDELSLHCYAGLSNLRAITKDTIRPFSKNRSGTLFSEGAGVIVLESEKHAISRGATPKAFVDGYAINNDAFNMTAPEKSGEGIARLMKTSIKSAGLSPDDIDFINCHGTGTKYNDIVETTAIKKVFSAHAYDMFLTSNKSCFGHAMGAAGALEAVGTVMTLDTGLIPPTISLDEADPDLDLNYCPQSIEHSNITYAMSNSYGLGGANSSVLFAL